MRINKNFAKEVGSLPESIDRREWLPQLLDKAGMTTILIVAMAFGALFQHLSPLALIVFSVIGTLLLLGLVVTYGVILVASSIEIPPEN